MLGKNCTFFAGSAASAAWKKQMFELKIAETSKNQKIRTFFGAAAAGAGEGAAAAAAGRSHWLWPVAACA
jgi:hypothetical protein